MKGGLAPVALIVGALVAVPLVIVVAICGGGNSSAAPVGAGVGQGLRAGTVPAAYAALVSAAGAMCAAAPAPVIAAQIEQESSWNPNATSSAGAEGISQFMPGTWPHWAQPATASPFDPAAAIPAQGRYDCAIAAQMQGWQTQGRLASTLNVTSLMLAGYNAGPEAVLSAAGIPQNGQTPDYVTRITARAAYYANPTTGPVSTTAPAGSFAAKFIAAALAQIGQPYSYAGGNFTGPTLGICTGGGAENDCNITGFDCSGLVLYAAYQASAGAIKLPHLAADQIQIATPVTRDAMRPGDVIAFSDSSMGHWHHIGIYIGNNQMIDAPESGELVRIDALTRPYYASEETWTIGRLA